MIRAAKRNGFTPIEMLVVIAIVALLIGLLLAAVQKVRAASYRTTCANNLRQLGMALTSYQDASNALPPGISVRDGADPLPFLGWCARVLPYLEQEAVWRQVVSAYAQDSYFQSLPHHPVIGRVVPAFSCPADPLSSAPWSFPLVKIAFTDYLGVEGTDQSRKDGVLFLDARVRFSDIQDGASNTLLVGERPPSGRKNFGWWYAGWGQAKDGSGEMLLGAREKPTHNSVRRCPESASHFHAGSMRNQCDNLHFWSYHSGGAHFLFCDGSVRFLTYAADPILPALATRNGSEVVAIPD